MEGRQSNPRFYVISLASDLRWAEDVADKLKLGAVEDVDVEHIDAVEAWASSVADDPGFPS